MEGGLFKKYELRIQKNKDQKKEVLDYIKEISGIDLSEKEIQLEKNKIKIQTSSAKKAHLLRTKTKEFLQEKGFLLT